MQTHNFDCYFENIPHKINYQIFIPFFIDYNILVSKSSALIKLSKQLLFKFLILTPLCEAFIYIYIYTLYHQAQNLSAS